MSWWHVLWTTFLAWPPTDRRGDWSRLSTKYAELMTRHGGVEMSAPLDRPWQDRAIPDGAAQLSPVVREIVARSIRELASTDRVAGDTPIRTLVVQPHSVQIVLACPAELLHQRVGRLKSRTATLLSFDPSASAGGRNTWSRGFWWARLEDEALVDAVAAFVNEKAVC